MGYKRCVLRRGTSGLWAFALALALLASSPHASAATPADVLSLRPFAATDHELFSPVIYPETSRMAPAAGSERSESQVSSMLDDYLAEQFPGDSASQNEAKAIFDSSSANAKIPSPSLRAALVGLEGTFAAPAVDFVLDAQTSSGNPKVTTVKFVPPSQVPKPTAGAGVYEAGTVDSEQIEIRFNNRYQAESPFQLSHLMAHEPLHADTDVADYEEVVNQALEYVLYIDQLADHPSLAGSGSELSRRSNSNGMALLNSGAGSRIGLYVTNRGELLFPDSTTQTFTSWWDQFDQLPNLTPTPGNALLGSYLANIHEGSGPPCSAASFDKALLDCIDADGVGTITPERLLAAATAMKLDTSAAPTIDPAACARAKSKLKKAKSKLKRLKKHGASKKSLSKAKQKVKRTKAKARATCQGD